jgi:cytochrome c553
VKHLSVKLFFFLIFFHSFTVQQTVAKTISSITPTLARCAACHGNDGNALNSKTRPKLAGQNVVYLLRALTSFRPGMKYSRKSSIMNTMVFSLSEKEMLEIANYYAALPGTIDTARADLVPLGQRLYRGGSFQKGVPACLACHGPAGLGNPAAGFPRLSGQHAIYIAEQLKAFRAGKRVDEQQMMSTITKKMNDADIEALASYISGLYF